jgi:hypothetical protein
MQALLRREISFKAASTLFKEVFGEVLNTFGQSIAVYSVTSFVKVSKGEKRW